MKPTRLKLRNFKAIGNQAQSIELAPITLLFGPNSAGKSTVLQSLIYLREVLVHGNYDPDTTMLGGDWLDLGGFRNLIHQRDTEQAIMIALDFKLESGEELPSFQTAHEREELERQTDITGVSFLSDEYFDAIEEISLALSIRWSDSLDAPFVEALDVSLNRQLFARVMSSADGKQVYFEKLDLSHPVLGDDTDVDSLANRLGVLFRPNTSQLYSNPDENRYSAKSLDEIAELIKKSEIKSRDQYDELLRELNTRPSRRAGELCKELETKKLDLVGDNELINIGLRGQTDAMPDLVKGIMLDEDAWVDVDDWVQDNGFHADAKSIFTSTRLQTKGMISSLVAGSVSLLKDWLDDIFYIGPIRDLPPRNLQPQMTPDRSRWSKGLAAWEYVHTASANVCKEINYWLGEKCLKTGYQLDVQRFRELPVNAPALVFLEREMDMDDQLLLKEAIENQPVRTRVRLLEEQTGLSVMPQDIGVGISQVFPVVVLTIIQKTGVVAIEQPELHIHPALQVELADLFARYAIQHNKLMLLETHSEHLLLRLLRRIRSDESNNSDKFPEKSLREEDVSVQYVQPTPEGTHFKRLRIDADGDFIDEWPNGFFDERDEELF